VIVIKTNRIRITGDRTVTEILNNLDVMLSQLHNSILKEHTRKEAVPKLLQAAKLLIEAAENISKNKHSIFEFGTTNRTSHKSENVETIRHTRFQEEHVNPAYYQQLSKTLYQVRRARDRAFNELEIFADPAWDILLDLADADSNHRSVSITSACIAACVPPTTGLRWVTLLEARNYIERTPDGLDGRRRFLRLTDKARKLMNRFYIDLTNRRLI
jgi:DNA-binding MarR family transcriptional regulator